MTLATLDDVVARLGRPAADSTEESRIQAYLDDATALVIDYCRRDFAVHTDETIELLVEGGQVNISLGLLPNLAISSITLVGEYEDRLLTVDDWKLMGPTLYLRHAPAYTTILMTASWGLPSPPPVVKAAICAEVIRWLAVSPGTIMEKTGDLEVQYAAAANNPSLSDAAKSMLSRYRQRIASVTLHRSETHKPDQREITWRYSTTS